MSRKSRESPMLRSRPPTRPPTRSDLGEGDEGPREGTMSRKSRESPMLRSRPPTRPPTRSDLEEGDLGRHRAGLLVEEDDPPEEAVFEPAPSPRERENAQKTDTPDTNLDPDV